MSYILSDDASLKYCILEKQLSFLPIEYHGVLWPMISAVILMQAKLRQLGF